MSLLADKDDYRIGEAAELVGVERHVLRYWESEFGLEPKRSVTNHRVYSRDDVTKLLKIRRLLHEEGFTIAGAKKALSGAQEPATGVDAGRVNDALQRLSAVRAALKTASDRYARVGVADGRADG